MFMLMILKILFLVIASIEFQYKKQGEYNVK